MCVKDEALNLVAEGTRMCTRFRRKENTTSVYLRLDPLDTIEPVFVSIIGRTENDSMFTNYTYQVSSFPILAGRTYMLYNSAPAGTEVRLEFHGNSALYLRGVWSPDSVPARDAITVGPEYKTSNGNTKDEPIGCSSSGEFVSPFRQKLTSTSVYLNLEKSRFKGVIECRILGKHPNSNEIANCTYKASHFMLQAGKKYAMYNTVHEDGYELAAVSLKLENGDVLNAMWSPDYTPMPGVVTVTGGGSAVANTSDTPFSFTVDGKAQTESRTKGNSTSVYLNITSLSAPVAVRVFGVGGCCGTRNETYKCDSYMIDHPGKFMMYNYVKENNHSACFIEFEGKGVRVQGVWSPDSVYDPEAVEIGSFSSQSYRIDPVRNPRKLINVPFISQQGIPTGCESVSATMVLRYFGIDIRPYDFITRYLPKLPYESYPDPNSYFVGNPYSKHAFGCFAPCITSTIKRIVDSKNFTVLNTTGRSLQSLCSQFIDAGTPVIVWATMHMAPTRLGSSTWVIKSVNEDAKYKVGETFKWPGNEHCLVLVGYNNDSYFVNDPLAGVGSYPKSVFEARFAEQGSQSVVLSPVTKSPCCYPAQPIIAPVVPHIDTKQEMDVTQRVANGLLGAVKVAGGVASIMTGVTVMVGTSGIGAVGGGALAGFGAANTMEGVSDIVNACMGKDERGINPVRDYLFMGNQEFYDVCDIALSLGVASIEASTRAIGKSAVHFASPEAAKAVGGKVETWWIKEEGQVIYGRKYGMHALERMAPNTPEVRSALRTRYLKKHPYQGWDVSTKEFQNWANGMNNYIQPRNIPAMVVEDIILHEPRLPNFENGIKCADKWRHSRKIAEDQILHVIVNAAGDVITVMRETLKPK